MHPAEFVHPENTTGLLPRSGIVESGELTTKGDPVQDAPNRCARALARQ
jgi:hypothetical protein